MGENQLLVDTDVLIAYLNHRVYRSYLESARYRVFYSAITKKELLSKRGLKTSERRAILALEVSLPLTRQGRCTHRRIRASQELATADAESASLSRSSRPGLISCRSQTPAIIEHL
jgi:predicted nucleic acid-binding protein